MDYINRLLYFFKMSSEIETKLIDEPESLLSRKRQKCLRLIMRNGMSGHRRYVACGMSRWQDIRRRSGVRNGACEVRTEDCRYRSARKTSLCAFYCAESCGRLFWQNKTISVSRDICASFASTDWVADWHLFIKANVFPGNKPNEEERSEPQRSAGERSGWNEVKWNGNTFA